MNRRNRAYGRWLQHGLLILTVVAGGLMGCRNNETATADADGEEGLYRMGTPIDDSTYALIIEAGDGGDTLTTRTFQAQMQNYLMQVLQQQPGVTLSETDRRQVRKGIAEEYIRRRLLLDEAARRGLQADEARIEAEIDAIIQQSRLGDRAALEQAIAAQGVTMDSLRHFLGEQIRFQMVQEELADAAAPTPGEIDTFRQKMAEEVWAQHILFQIPDAAQEPAVIEKAEAVLDSVKAGADFAMMARRHSEGPSAPQGGDLGYFNKSSMVEPFAEAAFALADSGDVSPDLVQTTYGYHIIRLLGRRTAALMDTTRARVLMTRQRQREAFDAGYRALCEDAVIRVNIAIIDADLNTEAGG